MVGNGIGYGSARRGASAQVVLTLGLVWTFGLSGIARVALGQVSALVTATIAATAAVVGLVVIVRWKDSLVRVLVVLLTVFTIYFFANAAFNGLPIWQAAVSWIALASPLGYLWLVLAISPASRRWLKWVIACAVWANLCVLSVQLLTIGDPDRGVGLLGNERASNTLAVFTLLGALGMFYVRAFNMWVTLPTLLVAGITAWYGDAKLALAGSVALSLSVAIGALVSRLTHRRAPQSSRLLASLFTVILLALCLGLAVKAIGTESGVPLHAGPYTAILDYAKARTTPVEIEAGPLAVGEGQLGIDEEKEECCATSKQHSIQTTNVLIGTGPGTGDSANGLLIRQGRYNFLHRFGEPIVAEVVEGQVGMFSNDLVGTAYSRVKTSLGLLTELGWIGLSMYVGLLMLTLVSFRRRLDLTFIVGLLLMLLLFLAIGPFWEYPEVAVATAAFIVLVQGVSRRSNNLPINFESRLAR